MADNSTSAQTLEEHLRQRIDSLQQINETLTLEYVRVNQKVENIMQAHQRALNELDSAKRRAAHAESELAHLRGGVPRA